MKNGLKDIVGKRIATVVVARNEHRHPRHQVFLVFDDGNRLELYGEAFTCCSGLDRGAGIEDYVEGGGGRIVSIYGDASVLAPASLVSTGREAVRYITSPPEASLENLLKRDLDAWIAAKAVVEKARRS